MNEIKQPKHSISLIIAAVSRVTDVPASLMKSENRSKEVVRARAIAVGIIYSEHKISLKKLGVIFGGRNHATIINSTRRFKDVKEKPALDRCFSNELVKVLTILN